MNDGTIAQRGAFTSLKLSCHLGEIIPIDGVEVNGISATRNKFRMALKRVIRAGEKDWE